MSGVVSGGKICTAAAYRLTWWQDLHGCCILPHLVSQTVQCHEQKWSSQTQLQNAGTCQLVAAAAAIMLSSELQLWLPHLLPQTVEGQEKGAFQEVLDVIVTRRCCCCC
jgi:hypothetical protein